MSKDGRQKIAVMHATLNAATDVSVVWNKNGMHKSETKTKQGFYSKKRLKTTEILRSLSIFRVKTVHRVNKTGNSSLAVS